ncbi:FadR/GntR family transcriptional regulator [Aurantiacibacter suaedae]|uniref:FadR/GntR family transcriptional regulator n=1 Tax=Aurantiacibacter suaedae TaxID=2545755 RepID=UPI0010F72F1D|nr:FadR/GntR family transcriptional regulator [Aurantiacibacter suaedae]
MATKADTRRKTRSEFSHSKIARDLGTAIVTGRSESGTILPGEVDLAAQFGVSRSVVREAMRALATRGLIESKPKIGTRVREREHWHLLDPVVLQWMFDAAPSPKFVKSLFELRMIVEPAAAELAARKKTGRHLATMGHALEEMARHTLHTPDGQMADQAFHAAILEASDNELLVNLSASIGAAVRWTTYFKFRSDKKPRDPIEEHRALFDAIAEGDGDAAREAAMSLIGIAERETEAALQDAQ